MLVFNAKLISESKFEDDLNKKLEELKEQSKNSTPIFINWNIELDSSSAIF